MSTDVSTLIDRYVRDIPDYPQPGVVFKDITPLLSHPTALRTAIDALAEPLLGNEIDLVAGGNTRFHLRCPCRGAPRGGFVPLRKAETARGDSRRVL